MLFRLRNAVQTSKRLIDDVFGGCDIFCAHVDDCLTYDLGRGFHCEHLDLSVQRLKSGSNVNTSKCRIGTKSLYFIVDTIDTQGNHPLENKAETILD